MSVNERGAGKQAVCRSGEEEDSSLSLTVRTRKRIDNEVPYSRSLDSLLLHFIRTVFGMY